jgi:hypothetical protein
MLNFPAFHQWPAVSFENDFSPLMGAPANIAFAVLRLMTNLAMPVARGTIRPADSSWTDCALVVGRLLTF